MKKYLKIFLIVLLTAPIALLFTLAAILSITPVEEATVVVPETTSNSPAPTGSQSSLPTGPTGKRLALIGRLKHPSSSELMGNIKFSGDSRAVFAGSADVYAEGVIWDIATKRILLRIPRAQFGYLTTGIVGDTIFTLDEQEPKMALNLLLQSYGVVPRSCQLIRRWSIKDTKELRPLILPRLHKASYLDFSTDGKFAYVSEVRSTPKAQIQAGIIWTIDANERTELNVGFTHARVLKQTSELLAIAQQRGQTPAALARIHLSTGKVNAQIDLPATNFTSHFVFFGVDSQERFAALSRLNVDRNQESTEVMLLDLAAMKIIGSLDLTGGKAYL